MECVELDGKLDIGIPDWAASLLASLWAFLADQRRKHQVKPANNIMTEATQIAMDQLLDAPSSASKSKASAKLTGA